MSVRSRRSPLAERAAAMEAALRRIDEAMDEPRRVRPLTPDAERLMLSALCQGLTPVPDGVYRPYVWDVEVARALLAHPDLSEAALVRLCYRSTLAGDRSVLLEVLSHPSATVPVAASVCLAARSSFRSLQLYERLVALHPARAGFLVSLAALWDRENPSGFHAFFRMYWSAPPARREVFERLVVESEVPLDADARARIALVRRLWRLSRLV